MVQRAARQAQPANLAAGTHKLEPPWKAKPASPEAMMQSRPAVLVLALASAVQMCSGFCPSPAVLPGSKAARVSATPSLRMQADSVSRRSLLQGALGASAADTKQQQPEMIRLESGLVFQDKNKKTGLLAGVELSVGEGSLVIIDYIAYLRDGTIFDNTIKRGKPLAFQMGKKQVIPGLEQGLLGMKAGEERRLFVPAKLGYGERGVCFEDRSKGCLVPPNTDLVYDVTLVRVAPTPSA